ncbi:hypothetical protein [Plantibacter sp. YIM 135347]|uniref:hypothetical protein n=1 Tax=Plantibacter sp. YIM 135347 TaxID=3423919 RepID=UPI003D34A3D8
MKHFEENQTMTDSTESNPIDALVEATNPTKPSGSGRFATKVAEFVKDADDWLTPADMLAVAILEALAEELDQKLTGALMAQFGMTYRDLLKRAPGRNPDDDDPVAKAIRAAAESREAAAREAAGQ